MALGFVAAFCGDGLLVFMRCGVRTTGFLFGVLAFSCAHILWATANRHGVRPDWRALAVVVPPVMGLLAARAAYCVPFPPLLAASAYTAVSAVSLAVAVGSRRLFYALGIGCLVLSDVFIVCGWINAPFWHKLTGPVYILALICMAVSLFARDREPRFRDGGGKNPLPVVLVLGALCAGLFLAAMLVCPGGNYNPLMRMLSYLGRTFIEGVPYPLCHYLFTLGMAMGAAATLYFAPYFRAEATTPRRRSGVGWGAAVCAGGLLLIACVPENVSMPGHNAGCWLAFLGGLAMLLALANTPPGRRALFCLLPGALLFGLATLLHALTPGRTPLRTRHPPPRAQGHSVLAGRAVHAEGRDRLLHGLAAHGRLPRRRYRKRKTVPSRVTTLPDSNQGASPASKTVLVCFTPSR